MTREDKLNMMRKERIMWLEERLANTDALSSDEYKTLLEEIRKNYTILLSIQSVRGSIKDTGGIVNIIDKVHWLLDSIKEKDDDNKSIDKKILGWESYQK